MPYSLAASEIGDYLERYAPVRDALVKAEKDKLIRVPAKNIIDGLGYETNRYQLTVYRDGEWHIIPFQIEEFDEEGNLFFSELNVPSNGDQGVFDGGDSLTFLFSDAGSKAKKKTILTKQKAFKDFFASEHVGKLSESESKKLLDEIRVHELLVQGYTTESYAYLWVLPETEPVAGYIHYDLEKAKITTPNYHLISNKDNLLEWTGFFYNSYTDKEKETLVDILRMRISGKVLANLAKLSLTNKNLKAQLVSYKQGPISATLLLKTKVQVAKIPVASIWLMLSHYPSRVVASSRATTLKVVPWLFRDVVMSLSIDANDLRGSKVYSALLSHQPALVNGELSRHELNMQKKGINRQKNWILVKSPKNFQIMTHLVTSEKYPNVEVELDYRDDLTYRKDPERYPGQLPNIGYRLANIPMDAVYNMRIEIHFSDNDTEYDIPTYVDYTRRLIPVNVNLVE